MDSLTIILWVACVVLTHGFCLAFLQRRYSIHAKSEYALDFIFSLSLAIISPFGIIMFLIVASIQEYSMQGNLRGLFRQGFKLF